MDEWSAYSCANFLFMLGDIPTYLAMLIVYVETLDALVTGLLT